MTEEQVKELLSVLGRIADKIGELTNIAEELEALNFHVDRIAERFEKVSVVWEDPPRSGGYVRTHESS
jgi:hypothetical protein